MGIALRGSFWAAVSGLFVLLTAVPGWGDVRLPSVIGDNMVLQRDVDLPIWGWAEPGEQVTVTIGEQSQRATAGKDGRWTVKLDPLKAVGPHTMVVKGNNELTLQNILAGEVWVCSGQSNMQWSVRQADNPQEETAAAKYPKIRLFHVPRVPAGKPQEDVQASWTECSPETVSGFSAVAYYFGRKLHQELDVPVGLIHTSWGGTRIEPWTPVAGFEGVPGLADLTAKVTREKAQYLEQEKQAAQVDKEAPNHPHNNRGAPTGLYNGMVHPLVPFAIRGAIWYQGESNRVEGMLYHEKMKALIGGWRSVWQQEDLPFYFVQLAPFRYTRGAKVDELPKLWEAQLATLSVPHTGMAVTTDIGNVGNIHPTNKQDVGKRLALVALARTYGQELVYSGPIYKSLKRDGNKVRLSFDHVGGGLVSHDGEPLSWFTIAGKDGKFVDAQAEIDGEDVVVSSTDVPNPVAVRFGWHQEAEPNLANKEGLPASPFRTDRSRLSRSGPVTPAQ